MIWNLCIRRPVLTVVVILVIAIFGLVAYVRMPLREMPDVEFPVVSVTVVYFGAEPKVVETEVLEPLEEEINTIEGLKDLTSSARDQVGVITAEFELWRDIDVATQDVHDRVNRARRALPDAVEVPIVRKLDPDARAVLWMALTGDRRWDEVRLSRYADETLKQRLESLRGVGRIVIGGESRYAVRIRLDPERMAAHHVTVRDVVATVRRNNVDIPSGRVQSEQREFLVRTQGQFADAEPFNDLIIAYREGGPVRIGDVGRAVDGVEDDRQDARFVGETAVGLGVVKQSGANTVALASRVRARMRELARDFPPGLRYTIASDDSEYIEESIRDLLFTIGLTSGLVVLVILGFLRTGWGTLIAALAIPTSLLGGVAVMQLLGFSLNTLSMLALILAIGIVIDDAIVIVESCYRHGEQGTDTIPAARVGTTEVAFPSVANTLSLAAVFLPVAFTAGLIGRFFFEFGLTVAATVFASTFTALTLTAMLGSRLLRVPEQRGRLFQWSERAYEAVEGVYAWLLDRALNHRGITVLLALGFLGLGVFCLRRLATEFTPTVDRSQFIISIELPQGATLSETDAYARQVEQALTDTPEVKHQFMAIGLATGGGPGKVNEGILFVRLTPRDQRRRHQSEVAQALRRRLRELPGGRAYIIERSPGAPMAEAAVQLVLQHSEVDRLAARQAAVMGWMRGQRQFLGVRSDLKLNQPQVEVSILRDKASQMNGSVADISNTLRYLLGEPDISTVERESEQYDVIPEIEGKGRMVPAALSQLYVRGRRGDLVPLGNLARLRETVGPSELHHFNRIRSATISASLPPGVALGDAVARLERHLADSLPGGFDYTFTGRTQDFQESFRNLTVTIAFSVVFSYLVLSAQFESFLHPLTILMALPLAAVGAFGALFVTGMPFGIVAFIGIIMLMGMATKNAILLIDYTTVLSARGLGLREATRQAARVRFRPVVMTTVSTVLGMMPIALGYGAGGEARAPLGVAVASGLLATTVLTLVVVPVVHTLLNGLRDRLADLLRTSAQTSMEAPSS
ncbi:MAG: efflux RND transporter permease subunit [Planctomycetota bacterium]